MNPALLPHLEATRRAAARAADAGALADRHARASRRYDFGASGALRALAIAERRAAVALHLGERYHRAAIAAERAGAALPLPDPPEWGERDRIAAGREVMALAALLYSRTLALEAFQSAPRAPIAAPGRTAAEVERALSALASEAAR